MIKLNMAAYAYGRGLGMAQDMAVTLKSTDKVSGREYVHQFSDEAAAKEFLRKNPNLQMTALKSGNSSGERLDQQR